MTKNQQLHQMVQILWFKHSGCVSSVPLKLVFERAKKCLSNVLNVQSVVCVCQGAVVLYSIKLKRLTNRMQMTWNECVSFAPTNSLLFLILSNSPHMIHFNLVAHDLDSLHHSLCRLVESERDNGCKNQHMWERFYSFHPFQVACSYFFTLPVLQCPLM